MTSPDPAAGLSVLHRLAILYLVLPVAIWLVGWFEWWFGIPAAAVIAAGLRPALAGSWRPSPSFPLPVILILSAIALGWTMASAAGGLFDLANSDWFKHRALFADLGRLSWPVRLPDDGTTLLRREDTPSDPLLRYYLAYYMAPGLAAKWFGMAALPLAVALWTWGGVTLLVLCFASSITSSTGKAVGAVVILVFFSGMDVVRVILFEGWDGLGFSVSLAGGWPKVAMPWQLEWGPVQAQYSSSMTGLLWVPQHFIAAGLGAMLLLESYRRERPERLLAVSGIVVVAVGFWSPFVAVGLMPLAAVLLLEKGLRPFLCWQNLVVAPLLAALLAVYLTSDSSSIPHGWLWRRYPGEMVAAWLPLFLLAEFLALVLALLILEPRTGREWFFVASVATLLVLPFYWMGDANDLVMRASLPSLIVLCWYTARTLVDRAPVQVEAEPPPRAGLRMERGKSRSQGGERRPVKVSRTARRRRSPERRRLRARGRQGPGMAWRVAVIPAVPVVVILGLGAVTPLVEIVRAVSYGDMRYAQSIMGELASAAIRHRTYQYSAHDVPRVLEALLRGPAPPSREAAGHGADLHRGEGVDDRRDPGPAPRRPGPEHLSQRG